MIGIGTPSSQSSIPRPMEILPEWVDRRCPMLGRLPGSMNVTRMGNRRTADSLGLAIQGNPTRNAEMSVKTMDDLFLDMVRDIYYAEKKLVTALPKMAKKASNQELKQGIEKHLEETKGHVDRLEQVFKTLGETARGKKCEVIEGLKGEAEELMEEVEDEEVLDAGLIAAAQAVEHYEIARYGTLVEWAKLLGKTDIAKLLQSTLEEEKACDATLTKLAKTQVNRMAA